MMISGQVPESGTNSYQRESQMRLRKILGILIYVPFSFCDTEIINFFFTVTLMSASKLHIAFPPQFPWCSFGIYFMPLHPTILFEHKTLPSKLECSELSTSPHPCRTSVNVTVRAPMLMPGPTLFPSSPESVQSLLPVLGLLRVTVPWSWSSFSPVRAH